MIFQEILKSFENKKQKSIVEYDDEKINYEQYQNLFYYFSDKLIKSGVDESSCVAVLVNKGHENFILTSVLCSIGCIVIMLDSRFSDYEIQNILENYNPDFLFIDKDLLYLKDYINIINFSHEILKNKFNLYHLCSKKCFWKEISKNNNLNGSIIFFTSGSTKNAKAVFRTPEIVYNDAYNNIESFKINSDDKALCSASFSHVYGFGSGCLPYLLCGATVKFINPSSTFGVLNKELNSKTYTVLTGLPIQYSILSENLKNKHNLRLALTAGSPINPNILKNAKNRLGFNINNMYGMTELGGISTLYRNINDINIYSSGTSLSNVQIKPGNKISIDEEGRDISEILVKSNALTPGYFDLKNKNFQPVKTQDGWFNTNDIGYIDEEGCVYVVGRKENMINNSGKKINPLEIENVILSYPGAQEAVVIGRKDDIRGEVPVAYIIADKEIDSKELLRFCYEKLPIFKIPKEIIFVSELPKTATGKILRNKITMLGE